MSAIAGILSLDGVPVEAEPAERMAAVLAWRGPDDDGRYCSPEGRVALAANRLAGLDPSDDGAMPLSNETHDVWLVLDGEILNYRALRHSLELVGHRFRSNSDAEVALHAYEQWDLEFLRHLQGAFALALWDDRRDRLVLARDKLGRKPLFVAERRGRLGFASAIGPLLDELALPRLIDPAGLALLLARGTVPAPHTLVAGITKLAPGEILVAERRSRPRRWMWGSCLPEDSRAVGVRALPADRHAGNLRTLLECSVADRLIGDRPVAVHLLPSAPSAALAAIAGRLAGRPAGAVAVFDPQDADTARDARHLADAVKAELTEAPTTAQDAADTLPVLAAALPEPSDDDRALANWFAGGAAARIGVDALLGDDGADEVLLAAPDYAVFRQARLLGRLLRPFSRPPAAATPSSGTGTLLLGPAAGGLPPPELPTVAAPAWAEGDPLETLGHTDLFHRVAESATLRADAAAQGHGIEARLPYLDEPFVAYALAVPGLMRSSRGAPRQMMRRVIGDLAPMRATPSPPALDRWMAGALGARLGDTLSSAGLVQSGVLSPEAIAGLLDRHRADGGQSRALWGVSILLEWSDRLGLAGLAPAEPADESRLVHSRS